MKNKKLTPEQIAFIKGNVKTCSAEVIASVLNISMAKLQTWCDELGVKIDLSFKPAPPLSLPVRQEEGRPAAVYDNVSREQYVERWLKKAI